MSKKSNIIVGIICRHPSMNLADFNCNYLNKLLENTSKEQKSIFLLGGFNVTYWICLFVDGDKLFKDLVTNKIFSKQILSWNFKMEF